MCRDIWSLHLSLLKNPPIQDSEENVSRSKEQQVAENTRKEDENRTSSSSDSDSDDNGERKKELLEQDEDMEKLMQENSDLDSSSEDEPGEGEETQGPGVLRDNPRKRSWTHPHFAENPQHNIAVLMVACWTLRLPVLYRDFIS